MKSPPWWNGRSDHGPIRTAIPCPAREVVIATIQDHQRYFAIEGADGTLTGGFVTVCNIQSRDPDKVREGNERVVRPRLRDAAFFWIKTARCRSSSAPRNSRSDVPGKARQLCGQDARVKSLALVIGPRIGRAQDSMPRPISPKRSFDGDGGRVSELQGVMGRYYAEPRATRRMCHGRSKSITGQDLPAIRCLPAGSARRSPRRQIDTLTGIFAIEQRPTGAKDPFGLRRTALGVLRILLECRLDLDLCALIDVSAAAQPAQRAATSREVYDFLGERLRGCWSNVRPASPPKWSTPCWSIGPPPRSMPNPGCSRCRGSCCCRTPPC